MGAEVSDTCKSTDGLINQSIYLVILSLSSSTKHGTSLFWPIHVIPYQHDMLVIYPHASHENPSVGYKSHLELWLLNPFWRFFCPAVFRLDSVALWFSSWLWCRLIFFMMGVPFLVDETPILHGEIGTFWLLEMCQNPQSSWEIIKNHEKTSRIMKNHQESWKIMKNHEKSSRIMKNHEESWKIIKNHEKSWRIMKNHEGPQEFPRSSSIFPKAQNGSRGLRTAPRPSPRWSRAAIPLRRSGRRRRKKKIPAAKLKDQRDINGYPLVN